MFIKKRLSWSQLSVKSVLLASLFFQVWGIGAQESNQSVVGQVFHKYSEKVTFKDIEMMIYHEELVYDIILEALSEFQSGNLHKFDPTAGDTCCQVRAHKTVEAYQNEQFRLKEIPNLITQIENNITHIKKLKSYIESLFFNGNNSIETMKEKSELKNLFSHINGAKKIGEGDRQNAVEILFEKYGINPLVLSPDATYITQSYFVTKFNSETPDILDAKKKLMIALFGHNNPKISKRNLENLVQNARLQLNQAGQEHIATMSDKIVRERCSELNTAAEPITVEQKEDLKSLQIILGDVGATPLFQSRSTYAGLSVILADLWLNSIPLLVNSTIFCPEHGLHRAEHFYVRNPKSFEFEMYKGDPQVLMNKAVVVFESVTNLGPDMGAVDTNLLLEKIGENHEKYQKFSDVKNCPLLLEWEEKLSKESFTDISLANLANHPQYVDKNKSIDFARLSPEQRVVQSKKFHKYCEKGVKEGMCLENMSFLRLIHVFPAIAHMAFGKVKFDMDREIKETISIELKQLKNAPAKENVPIKGSIRKRPNRKVEE